MEDDIITDYKEVRNFFKQLREHNHCPTCDGPIKGVEVYPTDDPNILEVQVVNCNHKIQKIRVGAYNRIKDELNFPNLREKLEG